MGRNVSRAKVKALVNLIIANNATSSNKVRFNGTEDTKRISAIGTNLTEPTYTVSYEVDEQGLIQNIIATANIERTSSTDNETTVNELIKTE